MSLDPHHPIQNFLFYVELSMAEISDGLRGNVEALIVRLTLGKEWVLGPPLFVDEIQEPENPETDRPIETLGGVLRIYSSLPPVRLPREIEVRHYDEVSSIIRAVQEFSWRNGVAFEFELNGEVIGNVENGEMDSSLEIGLLGEWKACLDAEAP